MVKVARFIFVLGLMFLAVFLFISPAKTETNILKAIFTDNQTGQIIVNLSSKFSSKVNVLIESNDVVSCDRTSFDFFEKIDKNSFFIKDVDFNKSFGIYSKYSKNFLSKDTKILLENGDYDTVTRQAFERLINPIGISIMPLEEDPFMLFTDYLMGLSSSNSSQIGNSINYKDKYYKIIVLNINPNIAFSPTLVNEKVKNLIDLSENLSNDNSQIYLTGVPIHSYYASSKSILEINLICVFSTLFIIGLFFFCFRNLKLAFPAITSMLVGIFAGFSVVSAFFETIHILTFVFSTTLIGVCIDYSLHYFVEKDIKLIFKSLTVSFLSTACAFLVLVFSGLELLRQISLFTVVGLFTVYLFILLFYPLFCKNIFNDYEKNISFELNRKVKIFILSIILLVIYVGFSKISFNDEIKNMYVPSKKLLAAEKLYSEVTNSNFKTSFALIEGKNIEDILQKEEALSDNIQNYQAISKFIPSKKVQRENQELRLNLYKKKLDDYATFLTIEQREKLIKNTVDENYIEYDNNSLLSEFMVDKNKSIMVFYDLEHPENIVGNGVQYIDLQKDISSKIKDYRKQCLSLIPIISSVLFIILFCVYKSARKSLRIISPSILASCFAISFVSLLSVEINMFHILSVFLIMGFGLDYSVFRASGVKKASGAILLSCATSVFSFSLLALTSFKLISSIGVVLSVGLISSYILSLVLIPSSGFEEKRESM